MSKRFSNWISAGWDPLGQEWEKDAAMKCNEQFREQIVLQVSSEPHRDSVFLKVERSEFLLASCHPLVSSGRLTLGYFIVSPVKENRRFPEEEDLPL